MDASLLATGIRLDRQSDAVISADGKYRYWLHRRWFGGVGYAVFVMLNPSTADGIQNDPTIRRCIDFGKRWGCHGIIVVNLFAARATVPADLDEIDDPVGEENHAYLLKACEIAGATNPENGIMEGVVVCAWGADRRVQSMGQAETVRGWIAAAGVAPQCLGRTKAGHPRHPLYVAAATKLEPFL